MKDLSVRDVKLTSAAEAAAYDRLYAIAFRILRDRHSAEDATQEAIVGCWRDLRAGVRVDARER